jgi:formate dehydrogenase maturation protein FdhE
MKNYAVIGNCPLCGQGRLIIAKDDTTGALYVLCEECESEWESPGQSRSVDTATRDLHGRSTFLEREALDAHPWKEFLW